MPITAIHAAVGPAQPNHKPDVETVQRFLNMHTHATRKDLLTVNGNYDFKTDSAIRQFQRQVMGLTLPDGIVGIGSLTAERLARSSVGLFCRLPPWESNSCKVGIPNDSDYAWIATTLKCEVAAVKAVVYVETRGKGGFYPAGRPVILFERHRFSANTGGIYNKLYPDISNKKPGGYGGDKFTAITEAAANHQYGRLQTAYNLDEDAAMESASWGAFQLMGENFDVCGYGDVAAFVTAMAASISNQIKAFTAFMQSKRGALPALQSKNWAAFAAAYNGPNYGDYDSQMAKAYAAANKK